MAKKTIYREPVKRLLSETGKNSSAEAVEMLRKEIEEYAEERADKASRFAEHANRKTIQKEDIIASKMMPHSNTTEGDNTQ